jgi:hypothetical protein
VAQFSSLGGMNVFCKCLILAVLAIGAVSAPAEEPTSVVQQVEQAVKPALAGLSPAPTIEHERGEDGAILVIRYEVRKFLVHGTYKSGDWLTNAEEKIGPKATGFVLTINLEKLGALEQLVTPQTLHEPYWQTFVDVTPVAGTTNQIYWALLYGARTDQPLLERLKRALGHLAANETRKAIGPNGAANTTKGQEIK